MITIGIDFDNTIITYDNIFFDAALKKGLIAKDVNKNKEEIRKRVIKVFGEEAFTLLQSDVYGKQILRARSAVNAIEVMKDFKAKGCEVLVISHKTKHPYKGPKYNLREMALTWMQQHGFFEKNGLSMKEDQVIFKDTKEQKIEYIKSRGCQLFIDDLPSIVDEIKDSVDTILFTNGKNTKQTTQHQTCESWRDIQVYVNKKYKLIKN